MDAQTLAKSFRLAAAFILIAVTVVVSPRTAFAIDLTGVDLRTTSGTLEIQRVSAETATLNDGGTRIRAKELSLALHLPNDRSVSAKAPRGTMVVGGDPKKAKGEVAGSNIPYSQIMEYAKNFDKSAGPGDLLLDGHGEQTVAKIGEDGEVSSEKLIWSDRLGRFLLPGKFTQHGSLNDDTMLNVTGAAVSIDQQFQSWTYYGDQKNPAVIVWERKADGSPAATPAAKPATKPAVKVSKDKKTK